MRAGLTGVHVHAFVLGRPNGGGGGWAMLLFVDKPTALAVRKWGRRGGSGREGHFDFASGFVDSADTRAQPVLGEHLCLSVPLVTGSSSESL